MFLFLSLNSFVCALMYVCCVRKCMFVRVSVRACVCACVRVYMFVHARVWVSVSVCVHVRVDPEETAELESRINDVDVKRLFQVILLYPPSQILVFVQFTCS